MKSKNVEVYCEQNATLLYGLNERPPWHLCIFLAIQQFVTCFSSIFSYPMLISAAICIDGDNVGLSELINTVIFVCGISTVLQTSFGVRLPIVQGPSHAYLVPIYILMNQNAAKCPDFDNQGNSTIPFQRGSDEHRDVWKSNLCEIQGSLLVATLFQIALGFSGLTTILVKYIGPLTIAPTICLIGLPLYKTASIFGSAHWWICFVTIFLIVLFSQYLRDVNVPIFGGNRIKLFVIFPVLLAIIIAWLICFILTLTGILPNEADEWGYRARTDIKTDALHNAQWFRIPYPGQWGSPVVSVSGVLSMMAASLASIVESVGDYYACARLCDVPPPTGSAINRGIGMEGIGGLLSGAWGAIGGNTSFSQNIGAIGITKVGSRLVIQLVGIFMILLGCLGKCGALFVTMPDPIVGGLYFVSFGMVIAVGISNLQDVNLSSTRNLLIIGISLFTGLCVPAWISNNPLDIGNETANHVFTMLLGTNMFLGGVVAFILDNTIPGSRAERGLLQHNISEEKDCLNDDSSPYDLPWIQPIINRVKCFRYIPICPRSIGDTKLPKKNSYISTLPITTVNGDDTDSEGSQTV